MSAHSIGWLMIITGSAIGIGVLRAKRRRDRRRKDSERAAEQAWTAEDRRWLELQSIAADAGELP